MASGMSGVVDSARQVPGGAVRAATHSSEIPERLAWAGAALRAGRTAYLPTIVIAGVAGWLSWRGWIALAQTGIGSSVNAGRYELAGPVVLSFVFVVCVIERIAPAQRRPVLARGHLLDVCYLLCYALFVVPLIVLLGTGFAGLLARAQPWLVLPRIPQVPSWCFLALAVLGIDAVDWLTHRPSCCW
ncbi:MAG TPA: hypothetical protein VMR14_09195 [Streptosporangiaceae bacterium]|jgi:hypothetical protein|nr:hypothetical protein [Streptosporangiaceae bacterium]